ncbi:NAD(P)-binding protein [Gonapodya prolifera JEL478]|uniref:NAD(P)-binding protein n=1 Tax=Gonapodya prolifera (strain JEL478) TaxID=1344416 RepID=A0A139A720_GONPJ|nr:NAD(P)-binding protein [Gonapodya prolifera JEL478]|eukprot:KXS12514.1 NAD(P)-binding protein [Gonapodya prolifera JEL478]
MAASGTGKLLLGKIALITGGASGIGAATALRFAKEGAKAVAITDLAKQPDRAQQLVSQISKIGTTKVAFFQHDVTNEAQWEKVVKDTEEAFGGPLDVLVNSAGVAQPGNVPWEDITYEEWAFVNKVNLDGTFLGVKYAIRSMKKNDSPDTKSIVNLSSGAGLCGFPTIPAYCASKGGVRLLSKSAALYLGGALPRWKDQSSDMSRWPPSFAAIGYIVTPMTSFSMNNDEALRERMGTNFSPMGRAGRPEEVAATITYLASEMSSFVTGADLAIDGGITAA